MWCNSVVAKKPDSQPGPNNEWYPALSTFIRWKMHRQFLIFGLSSQKLIVRWIQIIFKINLDKTDFTLLRTHQQLTKSNIQNIQIKIILNLYIYLYIYILALYKFVYININIYIYIYIYIYICERSPYSRSWCRPCLFKNNIIRS